MKKDFIINKSVEIFGSVDVGYQQVIYSYSSKDPYSEVDESNFSAGGLASLQSGITFLITTKLSMSIFGRGTLPIAPVSSNLTAFNFLAAPGTAINYRF